MSRFLDQLRRRLDSVFQLTPEGEAVSEARGVTFIAYLPDEQAAITTVFALRERRKMSAASAQMLEESDELARAGGCRWRLAMTYYLAGEERMGLEAHLCEVVSALGGLFAGAEGQSPEEKRQAA